MPKINYFLNSYKYFCNLNGGPIVGSVLDYGSNYGRFLESSNSIFPHELYTGIDVDLEALNEGKKMFPNAEFIHYNKHNYMYNNEGKKDIWPEINKTYDFVISYSVITHTTIEDMLSAIKWLYSKLNSNGKMFITYLDSKNKDAQNFFYNKRIKMFGRCDNIETSDYIYLVDNITTKIPKKGMLLTFYDNEYLKSLLSEYNVTLTKSMNSSDGCFQDCIIIKKNIF